MFLKLTMKKPTQRHRPQLNTPELQQAPPPPLKTTAAREERPVCLRSQQGQQLPATDA